MNKSENELRETLVSRGRLTNEQAQKLIEEAEGAGKSFPGLIIANGLAPEQEVLNLLAQALGIPFAHKVPSPEKSLAALVPSKIASYYKCVPVRLSDRTLTLAVSLPLEIQIQDDIRAQLGYDVEIMLAPEAQISECMRSLYGSTAETVEKMTKAAGPKMESHQEKVDDIDHLAEDASVINLVNQIILEAFRKRATDIHIEPYRSSVALRYRIDGILYDAEVPSDFKNFLSAIISRIKIMSNLNIVERRLPQDGRAVVKAGGQVLDLRISTIPSQFGESVVIRILPAQMLFNLEKLGLSKHELSLVENFILKPHGIVFVTGPTGSGKTTTLYACLSRINTRDRKIITIEDPIEYEISGITQIQVTPEIGFDFARGLRSILRHDPDVIMVGEVRDLETAEIAIRVALTGHLVFSTLHTNDAVSGITRLIDIGVEPYLIASSVEAFIAQRLVRVICPVCRYEDTQAPAGLKKLIAANLSIPVESVVVYRGKGCANCNFTGFFGRTAIYEIAMLDDELRDMLIRKAPSGQIKKAAVARGMRTLVQDGWQKTIAGVTTPEEIMRVVAGEEGERMREFLSVSSDQEPGNADKRGFMRLDRSVNIRYKVFREKEELARRGVKPEEFSITKNLSAGGLLFISPQAVQIGDILELFIDVPGQKAVECLARVTRVEEKSSDSFDVAVCFLDLTGAQRAVLEKYVKEYLY